MKLGLAADAVLLVATVSIGVAILADGRLVAGGFLLVVAVINIAFLLRSR